MVSLSPYSPVAGAGPLLPAFCETGFVELEAGLAVEVYPFDSAQRSPFTAAELAVAHIRFVDEALTDTAVAETSCCVCARASVC